MGTLRTEQLRTFQITAHAKGFIELNECADGSVLWLRKSLPDTSRDTHQSMCIDSLTNSVTIFWTTLLGKVNSKTFRDVPSMEQWFDLRIETPLER